MKQHSKLKVGGGGGLKTCRPTLCPTLQEIYYWVSRAVVSTSLCISSHHKEEERHRGSSAIFSQTYSFR